MTEWMDETPYPGPDEGETAWSLISSDPFGDLQLAMEMYNNARTSATTNKVTTHFQMRPGGRLVNVKPVTFTMNELQEIPQSLAIGLEQAIGIKMMNPANMTLNFSPL